MSEPRFRKGQQVLVTPQGLAFGGSTYPATITEVCGECPDPRVGAPADLTTHWYHADVQMPNGETPNGLLYEYEIGERL